MWEIAKQFDFCYGHRVWSQELDIEFSLDSCLKCRHLHGHQGTINVFLEDENLQSGMVTDFKHLNFFKKWLDDTLDHKFIMDINDPLLKFEVPILFTKSGVLDRDFLIHDERGYYLLNLSKEEACGELDQCLREKYEGIVLVNFVPTSENFSKWIFNIVQKKMNKINIKVSRVQFYETPKSQSNYINKL